MTAPLLRVQDLTKHFPVARGVFGRTVGQVRAVDGVSFDIAPGETLGLVGESGCGKTTAGRCVLRLIEPTSGRVLFDGRDVTKASGAELTKMRRDLQIVFQDPYSSLNPRLRVIDLIGEALELHGLARGADVEKRVAELLRRVGLSPSWINRYPHEFSGGQRQRIGVARAIALEPKLVVCDEAVSALDVSIQAQVVNLLIELRREMNLSYLFIAHDLSVVRHISHRIAVMYLGQIVERGPSKRLFHAPGHPYTRALLSAIPVPVPGRQVRRLVLTGDVPSPLDPPSGCRFHTRCPAVRDECRAEEPASVEVEPEHSMKCVHARGLEGDAAWFERMTARIDEATSDNEKHRAHSEASTTVALASDESATETLENTGRAELEPEPDGRAARFMGIAGVALGLVFIGLGAWISGLVVAMGAYFAGVRDRDIKRRRADAWMGAALMASAALTFEVRRIERQRGATKELAALTAEISGRARATGTLPTSLPELGWRLYPLFKNGRAVDPWGNPWRYRAPGTGGRTFDLGSVGPDGVPSRDDVGHVPPASR